MKRTFTKYPSTSIAASVSSSSGTCYIDNYNKWNRPYNVLENILDKANRCLAGSGLSVPDIEAIGVADNGQIVGFYHLYKTSSGNEYVIGWRDGEWKLFIYDNLSTQDLNNLANALDKFNEEFNGIRFHEDRPLI